MPGRHGARAGAIAGLVLFGAGIAHADEPPTPLLNEWWQWTLSFPASASPLLDNTGKNCMLGQRGPLWFLAGNTGGRTVRQCALPAGTRVLMPVHNTVCLAGTPAQCFDSALADWNSYTVAEATLDGVPQGLIEQPPVLGESEFTAAVPRDGILGLKPGLYHSRIAAGRWVLVDLPEPGLYVLRVRAQSTSGTSLDVTYRLAAAEVQ